MTIDVVVVVSGNFISICVFLAPVPTMIRICKEKSTMGYQSVPYVVSLFSAMLWLYYALLKQTFLLITINTIGIVIETVYIFIYVLYAAKEARKQATKLVATLNVGIFSAIFLITYFAFKDHGLRLSVVGWICVGFAVSVFASPLSIVFQVIRTRSVEFMPFTLSFALTISAVLWFSYGLLLKDMCVTIPNILGFILGVLQMLLYGIYRNAKPIEVVDDEEKKVPAEQMINIVVTGNSEVHPIDSHRSSCDKAANADDDEVVMENQKKLQEEKDSNTEEAEEEEHNVARAPDEPCGKATAQVDPAPVLVVCAA